MAELDRFGVRVVSIGQGWLDYTPAVDDDPELREMRSIQTAVALTWAALERQKISRRTRAGLARARSEGKRLGRKPVSVTAEQVLCLILKGDTMSDIAKKLRISRRTAYGLRDRRTVTVTDTTHLTAQISIDAAAALGGRTVTVTTGAEVASLANGFTVGGNPAVRLNPFGNQSVAPPYNIEVVNSQLALTPAPGDITVTLLRDVISQCSGLLFSSNRSVVVSQGQSSAAYDFNAGRDPALQYFANYNTVHSYSSSSSTQHCTGFE